MQPAKVGAIALFVLTLQFLLTLLWILLAWPAGGLSELAASMAGLFREHAADPVSFAAMNLYNVSFAVSVLVLVAVLRRQFSDFPYRMDFVFSMAVVASSLYVASGVVPLVAGPDLLRAGDESAVNALVGISAGLLLGGTMASGFAMIVFAAVAMSSRRVPYALCCLMLVAGFVETIEWAVPAILILDPLLGVFWSVWFGGLMWMDRVGETARVARPLPAGEGALS